MRKKLWKVLLAVFTACCMLFAFAACGNTPADPKDPDDPNNGQVTPGEQDPPGGGEEEPPQGGGEEDPPQGGEEDENEGVILEEAGTAGLLYKLSADGTSYSAWGAGTAKDEKEIVIPSFYEGKPVVGIEKNAFWRCGFQSVTLGRGITAIADGAFNECSQLASVVIPKSVTSIGAESFSACRKLTSVALPSSVTSIGNIAFLNCLNLASVVIPKSVTSIGAEAFRGCRELISIAVEEGNTVYHSKTNCLIQTETKKLILGCKNSVIPTDGSVTSIGTGAFYITAEKESITIPNGVTAIDAEAFFGCVAFTSIAIPSSVTFIGEKAFCGCGGLESITVAEGNTAYYSKGNCLIAKSSKTLILGCKNSVIPTDGNVTAIGDSAFENCTSLREITIPKSVTSIGSHAFDGSGLERITFLGTREDWESMTFGERWSGNRQDSDGNEIGVDVYFAESD